MKTWRRVWRIAPVWAWVIAAGVQFAIVRPFWLHSSPAPYYEAHGDLYRGWPLIYGLDQGDVGGDDWGPFITHCHPGRLALDTGIALVCGAPVVALILWVGHRVDRRRTRHEE